MKTNLATDTLLLLGGAAAGAITMYLLDPDQGNDRRSQIASRAGHAAAGAQDTLNDRVGDAKGWLSQIGESARKWSHQAADQVASTAAQTSGQAQSIMGKTMSDIADSVQSLVDRAKDYTDGAQSHGSATTDEIANRANSLYSRAKSSALRRSGLQEAHPYQSAAGHTVGTAGILALGAGLMYFLDPAKGRARRAWTKDKIFSFSRKANKSAVQYGRHVGNKLQGTIAHAKDAASDAVDQAKAAMPEPITEVLNHAAESAAAVVSHHGDQSHKPM